MWSLAMKVRARNKPISSVPDRAKCQETGISALGWLRGLERREGRLPLSSGPRASLPALAGRGAASGVYHTPKGSPPGACLDQGLGSTHGPIAVRPLSAASPASATSPSLSLSSTTRRRFRPTSTALRLPSLLPASAAVPSAAMSSSVSLLWVRLEHGLTRMLHSRQ